MYYSDLNKIMDKATHDLYRAYTVIHERSSLMDDMLGRADKMRDEVRERGKVANSAYSQHRTENQQKMADFARMPKPTNHTDRIKNTFKEIYSDPISEIKSQGGTPVQLDDNMYEKYKAIRDKYMRDYSTMLRIAAEKDEREYRSRQEGTPSSEWNQDPHGGMDIQQIEGIARFLYELDSAYITGDVAALKYAIKSRGGDEMY